MEDLARKQLDEINRLRNEVNALRSDLVGRSDIEKRNIDCIAALEAELRSQNEKMEYERVTNEERTKYLESCIGVCVF